MSATKGNPLSKSDSILRCASAGRKKKEKKTEKENYRTGVNIYNRTSKRCVKFAPRSDTYKLILNSFGRKRPGRNANFRPGDPGRIRPESRNNSNSNLSRDEKLFYTLCETRSRELYRRVKMHWILFMQSSLLFSGNEGNKAGSSDSKFSGECLNICNV